MIATIIVYSIYCYLIWKRTEKIKDEQFPIKKRRLFYLPLAQFFLCALVGMISLSFDGNLPKDEIEQFVEEYKIIGDISSALLGLDLTSDQVAMYMITKSLHTKAMFIMIGSLIMMLTQIIGAYRLKIDKLVLEGIAALHTACIFYICYSLGEALTFMVNQSATIKLLNAISHESSSMDFEIIVIWIIPFHYLYHFVLEKYYNHSKCR